MNGTKHAGNFTFSNSDKTRGCMDILTVEGPAVTIYVTVETVDCST